MSTEVVSCWYLIINFLDLWSDFIWWKYKMVYTFNKNIKCYATSHSKLESVSLSFEILL